MAYCFDDADGAERHETQYFESLGNRGIYHKGWTAVTQPPHAVGTGSAEAAGLRRRRLGAVRHDDTTGRRRTTSPSRTRRSCASCSGCSSSRRRSTTSCRSTTASPSGSTRSSPAGHSSSRAIDQLLFGGMGRLTESSVLNMQEQVVRGHRRDRRPRRRRRRRHHRQGGLTGGWSLYAKDGKPKYCYNFYGLKSTTCAETLEAPDRAGTRCGSSSPTTAAASARAAPWRSIVDGTEIGAWACRDDRGVRLLRRRDTAISARITARLSPRTTARKLNGSVKWVELDVGADAEEADHELRAKDRFSLAMGLQ